MAGTAALSGLSCRSGSPSISKSWFRTRGVVLIPDDLSLEDWPKRAHDAGLTTIGLHHQNSPRAVAKLVESETGQQFLSKCRRLGLQVEFELHAMKELLPRELFAKDSGLFRLNERGERTQDANCCVHSERALEIIAENATALARQMRPNTGRYFFWGDDGQPWCRCSKCRTFSDSEQTLLLENALLKTLRKLDPTAQLAHLAYLNTLPPPRQVKPTPGVFLEYAPIRRRYDIPYRQQRASDTGDGLTLLEANLKVFPANTAQVLEYWLDVSRFSNWQRPAVKLPWNRKVFLADARTYASLGIRHVTTFAAWVDADYLQRFGEPEFVSEYGTGLSKQSR